MTQTLITFLASFLIWFMFAGFFVLWFIDAKIKRKEVLQVLGSVFLVWIITQVVKALIPVSRPFMLTGESVLTFTTPTDSAFPSTHAAVAFGLASTIRRHNKKIGFFFLASAVLVGAGRLLANVHYFWDIVAGAFLGLAIATVFSKARFFKQKV